jgi:archaemetzincin
VRDAAPRGCLLVIQPVGLRDRLLLEKIVAGVEKALPREVIVRASTWPMEPVISAYNWARRQYRADALNLYLYRHYFEGNGSPGEPSRLLVVGIVRGDGYVEGLNFVFGLASVQASVATVYTARLESENLDLTVSRISKEVVHEAGHLLGLGHCNDPSCVMSFSNSVAEVDRKGHGFCKSCTLKLSSRLREKCRPGG